MERTAAVKQTHGRNKCVLRIKKYFQEVSKGVVQKNGESKTQTFQIPQGQETHPQAPHGPDPLYLPAVQGSETASSCLHVVRNLQQPGNRNCPADIIRSRIKAKGD